MQRACHISLRLGLGAGADTCAGKPVVPVELLLLIAVAFPDVRAAMMRCSISEEDEQSNSMLLVLCNTKCP